MANKPSGGGGGSKSGGGGGSKSGSGGGGGGGSSSGGGGSKGGGGGGSSSGGGGGGGGSKSSGGGSPAPSSGGGGGGGSKPSAPAASAPSKPSNPILAAVSQQSGGGSSKPSGGGGGSDKKVEKATQQIKQTISSISASSPKIADPKAYQKALDVLKSAGKDTRVQNLKEKVQAAKTTAQTDIRVNAAADAARKDAEARAAEQYKGAITQDDLDKILADYKPAGQTEGISEEDLQSALSAQQESLMSKFGDLQNQYQSATDSLQQQRAGSSTVSTPGATTESENLNTEFEAFDPDLFSNLLGELESSKYRQKEWNERSAKAAYKY
jgi:gas vesicle protein